jgi:hypothetical protein
VCDPANGNPSRLRDLDLVGRSNQHPEPAEPAWGWIKTCGLPSQEAAPAFQLSSVYPQWTALTLGRSRLLVQGARKYREARQ